MPDATESVANIFAAEIGGRTARPDEKGASGDFQDTPLFNTAPMEGEDSDAPDPEEEAAKRQARAPRKPKKPEPEAEEEGEEGEDDDEPRARTKRHPGEIDAEGEDEDEEGEEDEDEDEKAPKPRKKAEKADEDDDEEPRARGRLDLDEEVEVKVDGSVVKVPLREALEGYSRTKTFHQRLNQVEQEKQVVARDRAQYAHVLVEQQKALDTILAEVNAMRPQEPNWQELFAKNPTEAVKQKAFWDSFKDQETALKKAAEDNHNTRVAEYRRGLDEHIGKEYTKLKAEFPHWNDQNAMRRDQEAMKKTAMKAGFTEQEVGAVYDSRLIKLLMKAARYDRLSSKKLQPKQSSMKPMPAGSGASRRGTNSQESMRRKMHARQGSVDSAAGVFETMLANE